ncbi:MAG: hypothetical protein WC869_08720 [Phycisphaerae bacterium]|jgi:hypothetical protein
MKKVLMVLGVLFLVVIVGFVAILIWAGASGGKVQDQFFTAVSSGEPTQVTALFAPALKDEVDEPVLSQWMAAVKANLGAYKGLSKTEFDTSSKYENGVSVTQSSGKVNFEKGQAQSELVLHDGKIVKFHVTSDKIPNIWFTGPAGTQLYQERGKVFLTDFLSNRPQEAFAMMHPALQQKMPLEQLTALVKTNSEKAGKVQSIVFKSESYDPVEDILKITYTLECENARATPIVKFQFAGLKGHLIAFDIAGKG